MSLESQQRPTWSEMDEAVRRLHDDGAPLVVVTLGAEGALAASPEQWWFQPTKQAEVFVDATGAGDSFAAGFLFGWCGSRDVRRGLVYGCACGAAAVSQIGGSTPLDSASIDASMRRNEGVSGELVDFPMDFPIEGP